MQRFLERLLMRNFTRHEETERFLNARVIGDVDQSFVHDLGTRFSRDIRAEIGSRLANGVDKCCW